VRSLAQVHLVVGGLAVAVLVVLVPPYQSPDETVHMCRAAQVSRGALLSIVDDQGRAGHFVDEGIWFLPAPFLDVFGPAKAKMTRQRLAQAHALSWTGKLSFCEMPGFNYGPFAYVPQAVGLLAGRVLGLSVLASYYLARVLAAATGLAFGQLALRVATRGQGLAFLVLMMPMMLFQLASTSQDAVQVPACVLVIALATRLATHGATSRASAPWGIAAGAAVLATGRPPVAPLALLALTPTPAGGPAAPRPRWLTGVAAAAVALLAFTAWVGVVAPRYRETRRGTEADPARQAAFLAEQPSRFGAVLVTSLISQGSNWLRQGIGILGWLDTLLPLRFYVLTSWLLVIAMVVDPFAHSRIGPATRALHGVVFVTASVAVIAATYLVWTTVGQLRVRGVQGRYFLPLVPLLGVALGIRVDRPLVRTAATVVAAVFAVASAAVTIVAVQGRYYG